MLIKHQKYYTIVLFFKKKKESHFSTGSSWPIYRLAVLLPIYILIHFNVSSI